MSFRAHLDKAKDMYRRKGLLPVIRLLVKRLLIERVGRIVYEANIHTELLSEEWPDHLRLLIFTGENQPPPELLEFVGGDSSREYLRGLKTGDLLFALESHNVYLHYGFVLFQSPQIRQLGETERFPLIANCYTAPVARGKGLYRRMLVEEVAYLKRSGHSRVLIETSITNYSSQAGIKAAGFQFLRQMKGYVFFRKIAAQWISTPSCRRFRVWLT